VTRLPSEAVSEAHGIDEELYGLPLEEFTAARNAAAKELQQQGSREEAERVRRLAKPTVSAWAVNQLPRRHGPQLERFLAAAEALRRAQFEGKGDVREATARERELITALIEAARAELGGQASETVLSRVRQTLEAAAVDEQAAAELRRGQLARELEPAGFGSLVAHAPASGAAAPQPERPSAREREAARRRLEQARARLREARELREAAAAEEKQAAKRLRQAQDELEQAERVLAAAEAEVEAARKPL
jgi:hypothetical protein